MNLILHIIIILILLIWKMVVIELLDNIVKLNMDQLLLKVIIVKKKEVILVKEKILVLLDMIIGILLMKIVLDKFILKI